MALEDPADRAVGGNEKRTRFNREVCAGLFLVVAAAVGYAGAFSLDAGSMSGVGSGLVPKAVCVGLVGFAVYLIALGLFRLDDRVDAFTFRGIVFVLGSILAFAATVRPLGLLVAGPLAMLVSAMGDPDTRPVEIVVFTVFMTACCIVLFKLLLRLPIPLMPPLLGY